MTAARRLLILLCTAAAVLWLAWLTMEVRAEPLEPTLCPVGSVDPACAQPVVNRPPDAVDDELRSRPGRTMRTNVLRNDSDPDGDVLSVRPNANRTDSGTFSVAADGAFAYTPRYGFAGGDSVSYTVSDSRGGSDTATVWIQVENAPPVVENEHFRIRPAATLRANLLANHYDPDGDTITVTSRLNVKRDGNFTSTPAPGFIGRESFGYAVQDQYGLISGGRIVIEVVNEAPVAANHRFRIRNDETASGNLLVGASDPDGDPIRLHPFSVTADARTKEGGSLRIDRDGGFNYLPLPGFVGRDSFGYTIIDGYQATGAGTVTVDVAANRRLVAGNDRFTTRPDPLRGNVLGNDVDPDGDALRVTPIDASVVNGQLVLSADGSFTSPPAAPGWKAASRSTTRSPTATAAAPSAGSTSRWSTGRRSPSTTPSRPPQGTR
jgi:large repetitive protein